MHKKTTRYLDLLLDPKDPEEVLEQTYEILPHLWRHPEEFNVVAQQVQGLHGLFGSISQAFQAAKPQAMVYFQRAEEAKQLEAQNKQLEAQKKQLEAEAIRRGADARLQKNGTPAVAAAEAPGPKEAEANGKSESARA